MKKASIITLVASALLMCSTFLSSAQNVYNKFRMHDWTELSLYEQFYVGKTVIFYEPVNDDEERFKLRKINIGKPYTVQSFALNDDKLSIVVLEQNNPKAKPVTIQCYNISKSYDASIKNIPLYILEELEAAKAKYVGRTVTNKRGVQFKVTDIVMDTYKPTYGDKKMASYLVLENVSSGETTRVSTREAFDGYYASELSRVEKPADESVRYGETKTVDEDGVTKYSYVDDFIDIIIVGGSREFDFVLKNVSDNSLKLVWNEAVFVAMDGTTSKVMHKGVKYSERDADQPASVIIRGAKLDDMAVPTANVRYSQYIGWTTDSMYPSKDGENGQVSLMLPIQVKETINEYIFVFDVKYNWNYPELHEQDL